VFGLPFKKVILALVAIFSPVVIPNTYARRPILLSEKNINLPEIEALRLGYKARASPSVAALKSLFPDTGTSTYSYFKKKFSEL
jgi:hypothetical protein